VPEQHEVVEVLGLDQVHHVGEVGVEADLGAGEVHPVAKAGEGHRIDVVAAVTELPGDRLPGPAAEPGARHQHVGGHLVRLLGRVAPSLQAAADAARPRRG
jgi:hypothetical protein